MKSNYSEISATMMVLIGRNNNNNDNNNNKYRLMDGHFHIGLVIIPRPPYWPDMEMIL
jgi:hypothetical protein